MRITLIIYLLSVHLLSEAQCRNLIQSAAQNLAWLDSLARQPVNDQVEMIEKRLLDDTCIIFPKNRPLLSGVDLQNYTTADSIKNIGKTNGYPAPLIVIDYRPLNQLARSPATAQLKQWYNQLRQTNFRKISVLYPTPQTAAIYGTRGSIGVVLLESR